MIVGTAGHIDHGKTSLVRALTGVDTDRLKEEKARGISVDLGFAYLAMPEGGILGFVDVPGHERFVHNMLAGATGIDFVLLVIAADDGVMPQTIEHLAIVNLLGIHAGAVAITKSDMVDAERSRRLGLRFRICWRQRRCTMRRCLRYPARRGQVSRNCARTFSRRRQRGPAARRRDVSVSQLTVHSHCLARAPW